MKNFNKHRFRAILNNVSTELTELIYLDIKQQGKNNNNKNGIDKLKHKSTINKKNK